MVPHLAARADSAPQPPPYFSTQHGSSYSGPWAHTMRRREEVGLVEQNREQARRGDEFPRFIKDGRGTGDPHAECGRHHGRGDVRDEYANSLGGHARRERQSAQTQEYRERAREQSLRDRALSSQPPPTPLINACNQPIPDVEVAPRGSNGHPIFPTRAVPDDESEYEGSEPSEDEGEAPEKWRSRERERVSKSREKAGSGVRPSLSTPPRPPASASVWRKLLINTIPEARNLLSWMGMGCPRARVMFRHLIEYFGHNLTALHPDGILFLLRKQIVAESAWLVATTGDATPMSRRDRAKRPAVSRNERRKWARQLQAPSSSTTTGDSSNTAPSNTEDDVPMPEPSVPRSTATGVDPFRQSYVGFSPPPVGAAPTEGYRGPTASLSSVHYEIVSRSPSTWVQGIRLDNGQWPTNNSPIGSSPLVNDLLVARFIHFISPGRNPSSIHRARFLETVLTGFSVFGLYERFVTRGQWVPASLPLERYPFDATNITLSQAFSWVHQHGIPSNSPESHMIHSYASSWRNLRMGYSDPSRQTFPDEPWNSIDVLNWPDGRITEWRTLMHGPPHPGVTTSYPRQPSGGLSMAAAQPDMGLEPGEVRADDGETSQGTGGDHEMPIAPDDAHNGGAARNWTITGTR
ncbi:hypothetical protein B0H13DRAFT_1896165 [Mycena leptocephala]|nr:hypothetical protein B0H13DRAFT_1896165 [Mycena leptocephala]